MEIQTQDGVSYMINTDKYEEIRQVFLDGIIDTQDAEDYDVTDCWYRKQLMILDDLLAEVKRLHLVEMSIQDFLDEKIDSLELCRNMRDMGVIE